MQQSHLNEILKIYESDIVNFFYQDRLEERNQELKTVQQIQKFIDNNINFYDRTLVSGHCTGSALITDPSFSQVVLTLHRKLGKWIQLGGHVEDDPSMYAAALREAKEESGLVDLEAVKILDSNVQFVPFDIDIHLIPETLGQKSHFHYDFRYLFVSAKTTLSCSTESDDLRWLSLNEAKKLSQECSMLRQFNKLEIIRNTYTAGS